MPTLKALKSQRYGTRHLVAGETFDARDRDVRVLTAIKRAELYVAPPKRGPGRPSKEETEKRMAEIEAARLAALPPAAPGWGEA